MKKMLAIIGAIGVSASLMGCSISSNQADEKVNDEDKKEQVTANTESKVNENNEENKVTSEQVAEAPDEAVNNQKKVSDSVDKETSNEVITKNPSKENTTEPVKEPTEKPDNNTVTEEPAKSSPEKPKQIEKETTETTVTGTFYGLADSSSIEVNYNGDTNNLSFKDDLYNKIDTIPYEAKVKFTYVGDQNGQNVITAIDVIQ